MKKPQNLPVEKEKEEEEIEKECRHKQGARSPPKNTPENEVETGNSTTSQEVSMLPLLPSHPQTLFSFNRSHRGLDVDASACLGRGEETAQL